MRSKFPAFSKCAVVVSVVVVGVVVVVVVTVAIVKSGIRWCPALGIRGAIFLQCARVLCGHGARDYPKTCAGR